MARTTRRKIGQSVKLEGSGFFCRAVVQDKFSRVPGTGSFDTPTINGTKRHRWRGYVENTKGVRERIAVYGTTMAELKRKVEAAQKPSANREAKKLSIERYLEDYFLPGIKLKVRPNTYTVYESVCNNHIIPRIGAAKFTELQPKHVDAWSSEMKAEGVGQRIAHQAFMTLKRAYSYALELDLIDRHPIAHVKAPKVQKKPRYIFNAEETRKLLAEAQGKPGFALLYLAISSSMRAGELFGLRISDLHLDDAAPHIQVTLGLVNGELGELKTASSRRRIDLSPSAVEVLKRHLETQKGQPNDLGLVFPNAAGGFMDNRNFTQRVLYPLLTAAELPKIGLHGLRHCGNSLLLAGNVNLKTLQARLGHSTSRTTLDVYGHGYAADGQHAAIVMESVLDIGLKSGLNASQGKSSGGATVMKKPLRRKGSSSKPTPGLEPGTYCLRNNCSTN
jgi:integrase